jgi:hypothetical protein
VETANGQLADHCRAKGLWAQNLCHTVTVWLSITGELPRLRFADLLAAQILTTS